MITGSVASFFLTLKRNYIRRISICDELENKASAKSYFVLKFL